MEQLPTTTPPRTIETLLRPPHLYGVAAIVLAGVASFFVAVSYLDSRVAPPQQVAAVSSTVDVFADIALIARAAIVYDVAADKVLFESNAGERLPLASITKVMLALVIAENLPLDQDMIIPYDTGLHYGSGELRAGERWKIGDVLNYTLLTSSNEGARMLAEEAESAVQERFPGAPAESAALWRMNALAHEIGMTASSFDNVSGLDISGSHSGGYGSARDIARLFAYAASSSLHVFSPTAENGVLLAAENTSARASNTNEALGDIPGLIMGKTGYTDLAGGNLAVMYDVGLAHPVVAVVLGSTREGRFEDMRILVPASRKAVAIQ